MPLTPDVELDNTRDKLRLLESMLAEVRDTEGNAEAREAELKSLQRQIKQLREESARYDARQPARR